MLPSYMKYIRQRNRDPPQYLIQDVLYLGLIMVGQRVDFLYLFWIYVLLLLKFILRSPKYYIFDLEVINIYGSYKRFNVVVIQLYFSIASQECCSILLCKIGSLQKMTLKIFWPLCFMYLNQNEGNTHLKSMTSRSL